MTRAELVRCMGMIAFEFKTFELSDARIDLWYGILGHHSFQSAVAGVTKLLATAHFEPKVADVNAAIVDVTTPPDEAASLSEAWEMATKAVREIYSTPGCNAVSKLPAPIQDAVRAITPWEIRSSQNPTLIQSQFNKLYQENIARARAERTISPSLKKDIAAIGGSERPLLTVAKS